LINNIFVCEPTFEILFYIVVSLTCTLFSLWNIDYCLFTPERRHCEEERRSNLLIGMKQALIREADCFVPRNDGTFFFDQINEIGS